MNYNDVCYDINEGIVNRSNKNNYKVVYGWKEPNKDYYIDFDWLNENHIKAYKNIYDNSIIYGIECLIDIDLNRYLIDYTKQQILFNAYEKACDFYDYYYIDKSQITFYNSNIIIDSNFVDSNNIKNYYPDELENNFCNISDEEY